MALDEALLNDYRHHFTARVKDALSDDRPPSRERSQAAIESCLLHAATIVCSSNGIPAEAVYDLMEAAWKQMLEAADDLKTCN